MSSTVLASAVVNVVANGVEKVSGQLNAVGQNAQKAGQKLGGMVEQTKPMKTVADRITGIGTSLMEAGNKAAQFGLKIGAVGGTMLGIFGTKAMAGTVEAERLSQAIERFFRVTGDALAPYVRQATELVNRLTQAFYTLPASTKTAIVQVALIASGIGMASAAFLALSSVAVTVGGVLLAVFTSPITLIAGLVAGATSAALAMGGVFDAGISANERITRVVQVLLDAWTGMKAIGQSLVNSFRPAFEWISTAFATTFKKIMSVLGVDVGEVGATGAQALTGTFGDFTLAVVKNFYHIRAVWSEVCDSIRRNFWSVSNVIAKSLATASEFVGLIPEGSGEILNDIVDRENKAAAAADLRSADELRRKNAAAMDELGKKLEANKGKAKELAVPLLKAFQGIADIVNPPGGGAGPGGGGFTMKVGIDIGPLESAFSRIQMAVANASGVGVDVNKAILGGVEQIAGNVAKIANAPPALAGIVGP